MEKFRFLGSHILLFMLLVIALSACSPDPTTDPKIVAGVYVQSGYEFYRWEEGLALMIWHDGIVNSDCATSTNEQSFVVHCQAISKDNVRFDWQLETKDGTTGKFSINDELFDLAYGSLFVITTSDGDTQVKQLKHDLSTVVPHADGVVEFGLSDPAILEHIQVPPILEDCVSSSTSASQLSLAADPQLARQALVDFFSHLHAGKYDQAVEYFGGSYDVMRDHNPTIDPDDYAALFRNACTINGAKCLRVQQATIVEHPSPMEYRFSLQFANEDGSIFSLGPCCGDTDPNTPHQGEFIYTVRLECTGKYRVVEMPVYVP
jgi:hypothetical protein